MQDADRVVKDKQYLVEHINTSLLIIFRQYIFYFITQTPRMCVISAAYSEM